MTKIAVVTSCYGNHDQICIPPNQTVECEWVLVTDGKPEYRPYLDERQSPWQVRIEPRPQLHPRMAAKVAKARPDWYADADIYLWMDSNVEVTSPEFVQWTTSFLERGPLAARFSRERQSLIGEADVAKGMEKYKGLPILEQAQYYLSHEYPDHWGLWWTGLMARRADCPNFGDLWLAEQLRWTYEDQLSFPWILWNMDFKPIDLSVDPYQSDMLALRNHRSPL